MYPCGASGITTENQEFAHLMQDQTLSQCTQILLGEYPSELGMFLHQDSLTTETLK